LLVGIGSRGVTREKAYADGIAGQCPLWVADSTDRRNTLPFYLARWNDMHMEGHARTWFTPKQKAELWECWKSGQCVADVARALEERKRCLRSDSQWRNCSSATLESSGEQVLQRPVELTPESGHSSAQ
jgi:hypothetical protein